MISAPWAAYGVSQAFYYSKSTKENTQGGVVYEKALRELQCQEYNNYESEM